MVINVQNNLGDEKFHALIKRIWIGVPFPEYHVVFHDELEKLLGLRGIGDKLLEHLTRLQIRFRNGDDITYHGVNRFQRGLIELQVSLRRFDEAHVGQVQQPQD